jgi:hypothetical protein
MQSPAHFIVGAAICRHTRCKPLGLALAFASHFVLDAMPHFNDPSLLPHRLSHFVGHHWLPILALTQLAVAIPIVLVWRRYRAPADGGLRLAAYVVGGGLIACSPDLISQLFPASSIAWLDYQAHMVWMRGYLRFIHQHESLRPLVAAACLLDELVVLSLGLWLTLRRQPARAQAP